MSRGFLWFAQNNDKTDYVELSITLAKSIKAHLMSFNKNCTSKKDYRTIHEVAPPTLIEQWEHK